MFFKDTYNEENIIVCIPSIEKVILAYWYNFYTYNFTPRLAASSAKWRQVTFSCWMPSWLTCLAWRLLATSRTGMEASPYPWTTNSPWPPIPELLVSHWYAVFHLSRHFVPVEYDLPPLSSLQIGVVIPELPRMDHLRHLELQWVRLTDAMPFLTFAVPALETFIMRNCAGPVSAVRYVQLITGLGEAKNLRTLELVRVPYLGRPLASRPLQKYIICRHCKSCDCKVISGHVYAEDLCRVTLILISSSLRPFLKPRHSKSILIYVIVRKYLSEFLF